jgi:hypothetical protein
MPDVSAAGTYTKDSPGCIGLGATPHERAILFAGSTVGSSCLVQYTDDGGTDRTFSNGTISTLPASITVKANIAVKVVFTGTPDCNFTVAG